MFDDFAIARNEQWDTCVDTIGRSMKFVGTREMF